MRKSELLVDYCQRCGAEIGSFDCCQSSTNKLVVALCKDGTPSIYRTDGEFLFIGSIKLSVKLEESEFKAP